MHTGGIAAFMLSVSSSSGPVVVSGPSMTGAHPPRARTGGELAVCTRNGDRIEGHRLTTTENPTAMNRPPGSRKCPSLATPKLQGRLMLIAGQNTAVHLCSGPCIPPKPKSKETLNLPPQHSHFLKRTRHGYLTRIIHPLHTPQLPMCVALVAFVIGFFVLVIPVVLVLVLAVGGLL